MKLTDRKINYYLGLARQAAKASTCIRRQYGAIAVKDDRLVSSGYNGSPRGSIHCVDRGVCWREEHSIPHGERYEKCRSVHAEMNAIINAHPRDLKGSILFLAGFENGSELEDPIPCEMCDRVIRNARIACVVTNNRIIEFEEV